MRPRGAWDFERLLEDWDRQLREIHAGKRAHLDTWNQLTYDLAVSVACGRPWLDHFACPTPGPVLVFPGEGGERATVRRIEAIATAKGVDSNHLADQLRLCFRVPRLAAPGAGSELAAIQAELAEHPAVLIVLDPLYLAAAGPAARTCTTWASSSRPSRASASRRGVRCWW